MNGPWNAFQCQWTCKWNCRLWLKWQHHLRAEISSTCTYIYTDLVYTRMHIYVYDHAERPAVYFDGCLSSERSQLNCVTWKCLNIIKANLIIEARTTTKKCMKEVRDEPQTAIWDALMAFDVVRHIINMLSVSLWVVIVCVCVSVLSIHWVPVALIFEILLRVLQQMFD